jgi:hypothetical protein
LITGNEISIKAAFIIALVSGVIFIIAGQNIETNNVKPVITIAIPLIIMGIYFFYGKQGRESTIMLEQFADSVYYLGFIYTLSALTVSMALISNNQPDFRQIVFNFSLALVTTIVGLTARIYLINFVNDEEGVKRGLIDELEMSALNLTRVIGDINGQMEALSHDITRVLKESLAKHQAAIDTSINTLNTYSDETKKAIDKQLILFGNGIQNSVAILTRKVEEIDLPPDLIADKLIEPFDIFANRVNDIGDVLNEILTNQRSVRDGIKNVAISFDKATKRIDKLDTALEGLQEKIDADVINREKLLELSDEMISLTNITKETAANIADQATLTKSSVENLEKALVPLALIPDVLDSSVKTISNAAEDLETVMKSIQLDTVLTNQLKNELDKLSESVRSLTSDLSFGDVISNLNKELVALTNQLTIENTTAKEINTNITGQIKIIETHNEELEFILNNARLKLKEITEHFMDAANYVSNRLGD